MEIDVRGWINRGGVDLRSFNIKSKSVAKELSSWKEKNEKWMNILCDAEKGVLSMEKQNFRLKM